jgi:hypothetical protein
MACAWTILARRSKVSSGTSNSSYALAPGSGFIWAKPNVVELSKQDHHDHLEFECGIFSRIKKKT